MFKKLFFIKPDTEVAEIEELRLDFKSRYHHFKRLLSANNKALEIMADIESALKGQRFFGMSFIRASSTAVSVNVFSMIKNLQELTHGKYEQLDSRFNDIQKNIDNVLTQKKSTRDSRLIIPLDAVNKTMIDVVGSKMASLGEVKNRLHVKVPEGFVITAAAFEKFIHENDLQTEINRLLQIADSDNQKNIDLFSSQIQQLIINADVPDDLANAIRDAWGQLEDKTGKKILMAMRSSALFEDSLESSFAGQYRSVLNVSIDNALDSYKEVLASKYSVQAIAYKLSKGFKDEDIFMCVGCMMMVDAVAGGVIYTRNPVDRNDDSIFIHSAWGLAKTVVDGSDDCDLYVVSRKEPVKIIQKQIKQKERKFISLSREGIRRVDLDAHLKDKPSITETQAYKLAEIAVQIENLYALPQDIEWAISENGSFYILQSRALSQMERRIHDLPAENINDRSKNIILQGGITASPGIACGPAYLASKKADILNFPEGAILVVEQALPEWAPLLNRAAAVVSGYGSFAGHLASVAREFKVPAIFGLTNIMKKLAPGEVITVDADILTIYEGEIVSLPNQPEIHKNLMLGSPVYETLNQVSRLIVPLNLINPDAQTFNPINCKTFHDITRFVHEKSVQEMFNFGKEHNFSERSSKQLYYNVPMQWWILNLDDGFKEEVKGKYVHLDNIVCIPMLAFWEGFAAIPWEGPPPIDGKGLASVMFQSTINQSLVLGVRSKYADRNYFMISKNYCSLNSRLGYHFSTMEAMVSDRPGENYISFQFKGGAADYDRRLKRAYFIKDILEVYGFRNEINEDHLIARIEGYEAAYMVSRLKILGYMTIHTRQLDMIMSNTVKVNYYQSKIKKDIDGILNLAA